VSKRRQAGDIVQKLAGAGFVGAASLVKLMPDDDAMGCCLCDDPDCREWATCWECDRDGKPLGGVACHVSECQMEDLCS